MNLQDAQTAEHILATINIEKERKQKLFGLRKQFTEILNGYYEIPEEEVFHFFNELEKFNVYIDKRIEKYYNQIKEL